MNRITRSFLASLLWALTLAPVLPAGAAYAQADTTAVAINTKDGSSIFKLAFRIHRTMSDVVDQSNAAVAFASCESCQTVAVAIQIVLVMSDPSTVTSTNLALAINEQCSLCTTFAGAYQFLIGTGGPVRIDEEGLRKIVDIRRALLDLSKTDLPPAELEAELDQIMDQIRTVLDEHLVPVGQEGAQNQPSEPSPSSPVEQASPTPTASSSPDASGSPTPAEPSPTATSGVAASPEA